MALLLLYLSIALIFSFLCSLLEASLLSITPSYINTLNREKTGISKDLNHFKDNIDRPLAAILTLNTFAHTIGAAGVGAQAQLIWGEETLTVVSVVLTIVILILTEIIPKTLGANYWQQLIPFTVFTLKILIFVLFPIVWVTQLITRNFKKDKSKSVLSRADFTAMAEQVIEQGVLNKDESRVLNNILGFNKILTYHIMTPRTVVHAAPQHLEVTALCKNLSDLKFSRIPVYSETIDNITGYVLKDEVLENIISKKNLHLNEIKRQILFVPRTMPLPELFTMLMDKKEHIAVVLDQYGGTSGIVTIEDIIETILGLEITDEFDDVADMQQWAREKWKRTAIRHDVPVKDL